MRTSPDEIETRTGGLREVLTIFFLRVTKLVLLSGEFRVFLHDMEGRQCRLDLILTDFYYRQTISGEHGLDSNGV